MDNSEFSITQLHEELNMSRTVFYNKIKSLTNCSPIDLIRQVRLRKAAELLLKKELKVYEVMYQVGFNDEKHFRQLFKQQYGVTPVEYQHTGK
jgi:AraC-like DNA-binding protein